VVAALSTRDFSSKALKFEEQFGRLIPNTIRKTEILTASRVVGLLVNLYASNEDIRKCKPSTILNSAGLACAVGLEFNNALGQSAIIPYKDVASWQPMYRGLITLASRSGRVHDVTAHVVMEQDYFEYRYGIQPELHHKPAFRWNEGFDLERDWRYAYSLVRFKDGPAAFLVMDRSEVERVKTTSSRATSEFAPWKVHLEEMIRKTPIKRHLKMLDLTAHANMAVGLDDAAQEGEKQDVVLDWKDYSTEDLDEPLKGYTAGAGEKEKPAEPDDAMPKPGGAVRSTLGPFTEDDFSEEEFDWLLRQFKAYGHGQTKAQLLGFAGTWRETKDALMEYLSHAEAQTAGR
jgi:phage RecT family recombinase